MVGSLLMVASYLAFAIGFVNFANEVNELTEIAPGERAQMELEARYYSVYSESHERPTVNITGDNGELSLNQLSVHEETWQDSASRPAPVHYQAYYFFVVQTPGTYMVSNAGTGMVAIKSGSRKLGRTVGLGFLVGTVLGVTGFIITVVALVRRRNARKLLRLVTGTDSGVPYNQTPGPYGTPPSGSPGTPPPGFGGPPAGPYGAQPSPPPPPPGAPPPGRWPQ